MSDTGSTSSGEYVSKPLSLGELLRLLQEILQEDPDAKKMPVYHTEFGGLVRSKVVEVCDEINGKKVKRFVVIE